MPCGSCSGFFLGWLGAPGPGPRLGVGEVKFTGMVLPTVKKVEYVVDLKRVILRKLKLGIADGCLKADGETIYHGQGPACRFVQAELRRRALTGLSAYGHGFVGV